jgi:hypothetical protein
LAFFAWKNAGAAGFQEKLLRLAVEKGVRPLDGKPGAKRGHPALLALRDLLHPLFLISLAATAFFLYFSEDELGAKIWILLRPLAIGFLFFYVSRTLLLDRWLEHVEEGRFAGFGRSCRKALAELRRYTGA